MNLGSYLETPDCPVCGSDAHEIVYPSRYPDNLSAEALKDVYKSSSDHELFDQLVRCRVCGVGYLRPRLNPDLIVSSYADAEDPTFVSQNPERIDTFRRNFSRVARELGISTAGTKVLDVGCAGGAFPFAARELGFDVIGVEPSRWMCEFARAEYKLDIRAGTLESQAFESQSFDVVTMWDVLEHVPAPRETLSEIHRILKPGGYIVVSYPDFGNWLTRLLGRKWPFLLSVHLTYYTHASMTRQLKEAGFAVDVYRPYWQGLKLGYVIRRASHYLSPLKLLESAVDSVGLGQKQIRYFMGQYMVAAHKVG